MIVNEFSGPTVGKSTIIGSSIIAGGIYGSELGPFGAIGGSFAAGIISTIGVHQPSNVHDIIN